jgi:hypothetical protein
MEDLEHLQKLIVAPLVDAVREEVKSLVAGYQAHETRLAALEGSQRKALLGYAGIVALITIGFNWIKQKVGL